MSILHHTTLISAPLRTCFDAARDLDLHRDSMAASGEEIIGGRTDGLIGAGESVVFRGRHFGVIHEHESRITIFDPPHHFRDEMVRGRFASFVHDHRFEETSDGTRMVDRIEYRSPCGVLGRVVEKLVLDRYLMGALKKRGEAVKRAAEILIK